MVRGDAEATLRAANVLLDVSERNGLRLYESVARMCLAWARARLGDADGAGAIPGPWRDIHQSGRSALGAVVSRSARGTRSRADVAGRGADFDRSSDRIGPRGRHPIHRLPAAPHPRRHPAEGSIPTTAAPAEEAYLAAIAVAREQGARSFGLLAALKLAKLYQSTARPVEAHDILAPALEGFAPTPEMPEIAEGQALLAALAETDEGKAAAASR